MNIDNFVKVRFELHEGKHSGIVSSDNIGIVELFEKSVLKVSRYTSPDVSETDRKSLEFQMGDIIKDSKSGVEYEVVNTVVEYHSRGVNYQGEPSVLIRVRLQEH